MDPDGYTTMAAATTLVVHIQQQIIIMQELYAAG